MGSATTVLTLDGIRRSVGAGTTFVQAEIQRPLSDLLPRQALGRALALVVGPPRSFLDLASGVMKDEGDWPTLATQALWNYLKKNDINMNWVGEAYNETVSGDTTEEITIDLFDCASATDASRALAYFKTPTLWDLIDPRDFLLPVLSWEQQMAFSGSWAGQNWKDKKVLLSTSQETARVTVNSVVYYSIHPEPDDIDICVMSRHAASENINPHLAFYGFRSFTIDNLAFLIVYESIVSGPKYAACESWQAPLPGGGTFETWSEIPYEWKQVGHSFFFMSEGKRLFTIDYNPFLDNFDQVLATVFHALSSQ